MEETFTLELTATQWKKLVAATYITGWITTAHLDDDDEEGVFNDLEQIVLQQTVRHGFTDLGGIDESTGRYGYTGQASEEFDQFVEEYDDLTFWEELATRLAERDVTLMRLSPDEKTDKIMQIAEKYDTEFEKWGLKNLFLKK